MGLFAACILATPAAAAATSIASPAQQVSSGMRVSTDIGGMVKINSAARLLAGLPPTYPGHFAFADTPAWKEHSAAMRAAWSQVSSTRIAAMSAWRDSAISSGCPAGRTLLYPFSGPDFFNAYWMFPDCENYVLFGLEFAGEVPDVENVAERDVGRLLGDVRASMSDLLDRNYFITENMSRQLRTAQLRGVIPLLIIPMAMSDVEILRIVPHELPRQARAQSHEVFPASVVTGEATPPAPGKAAHRTRGPIRQLHGITIEFRKPGSGMVQRLHYFTLDATDQGLKYYPEFLTYLNGLAPTSTLLKAASYLLHGREFRKMRATLLAVSEFLVQDDTGLPFWTLQPKRWNIRLYGRYETPIPPFQGAFQASLDKAYKTAQTHPLPFEFGYSYSDKRDNRSNVLVGRKTVAAPPQTVAAAAPAALRIKRAPMTRAPSVPVRK